MPGQNFVSATGCATTGRAGDWVHRWFFTAGNVFMPGAQCSRLDGLFGHGRGARGIYTPA